MPALDAHNIYQDFPILDQIVNDEPLVYLDNATTIQRPQQILDTLNDYYHKTNANVHRGVHALAERATAVYEASRRKARQFINAKSIKGILFTRGTTTGLNWVARFAEEVLQEDDEVLTSIIEHHSNVIPQQETCRKTGVKLAYVCLKDEQLDIADLQNKLSPKTKFVSVAHISNVLGSIQSVEKIAELAHQVGAYMVIDGVQLAPHMSIDVQNSDCDFFAFSGYKMLGPTGIGILYGKEELLNQVSPVEFGGEMIDLVYEQGATWKELPWRFETGTPNIAGAITLGTAVDYLTSIGMDAVHAHEQELVDYILLKLQVIDGLAVYGPQDPSQHMGVIAFNLDGLHPHDVAMALNYEGVVVCAGHHCAQPLITYLDTYSAVRASFYIYDTKEDCDRLVGAILKTKEFFNGTF